MDMSKIEIIIEWIEPKFFRNVQVFLGFINFYRRFIKDYSRIAAPLTSIFKNSINGRKIDPFEFTEKKRITFELLKVFFIRAPILIHFKSDRSIKVEIDISDCVIAGMLS
jgi:hypothetical protein